MHKYITFYLLITIRSLGGMLLIETSFPNPLKGEKYAGTKCKKSFDTKVLRHLKQSLLWNLPFSKWRLWKSLWFGWELEQSVGYLHMSRKCVFSPPTSTSKTEAIRSSELRANVYQTTWHHILEESILHNYYWFTFQSNIQENSQRMLLRTLKENCRQRNQM